MRTPYEDVTSPGRLRAFTAGDFGSLIRRRRKELGYTQEYMADVLGWSPRLIGDIERGKATVGIQRVLDLATNLGIDVTLSVRGKD
ncbi:helix-turn-helix transcriptional regulator [bacterium]|nr:helix-turn-helix transcriptional regulator [bacterium]